MIVLRAIADNGALMDKSDNVILKEKWDEDGGCRFWLNSHLLDTLFTVAKAVGASALVYAHQDSKGFEELTGKEPADPYYNYLWVGLI